jgi:hypothetical protein
LNLQTFLALTPSFDRLQVRLSGATILDAFKATTKVGPTQHRSSSLWCGIMGLSRARDEHAGGWFDCYDETR